MGDKTCDQRGSPEVTLTGGTDQQPLSALSAMLLSDTHAWCGAWYEVNETRYSASWQNHTQNG